MISEKDILILLRAIEMGELKLKPEKDPNSVFSGNIIYNISNGWQIIVFNDANTWDYIDSIKTDDGRIVNFEDIDSMSGLRNYEPSKKVQVNVYKIGLEE